MWIRLFLILEDKFNFKTWIDDMFFMRTDIVEELTLQAVEVRCMLYPKGQGNNADSYNTRLLIHPASIIKQPRRIAIMPLMKVTRSPSMQ